MENKYAKLLGQKIRELRTGRDLTQKELGERAGISAKYLQFIEAGTRDPSLKTVYMIAKGLKVKLADLFTF